MACEVFRSACAEFFEYDTPMIVHIKNRTVGIINRLLEFSILIYIVFYGILYEKGYQEFDEIRSSVSTKVKGIIFDKNNASGRTTWDVADYVIPPQEANAFFVITSVVVTNLQQQATCGENPYIKEALCDNENDCLSKKGSTTPTGNGPFTGKCIVNKDFPGNKTVCEIAGWCPVEDDGPLMQKDFNDSERFTVLIKNVIEFPKFGFRKRNIMNWYASDKELGKCRWNPKDPRDKYCPIFFLGDIVKAGGATYSSILNTGAIIKIIINWDCNLDFNEKYCVPEYSVSWLDNGNYTVAAGFNFRYADHFFMQDEDGKPRLYRDLYKAIGIHFLVEVRGIAGKFHFVNLMFNVGSGMALLGIASILSDIVVLNFLKARRLYKEKKFHVVEANAYETLPEDTDETPEADVGNGDVHTGGRSEPKEDKITP